LLLRVALFISVLFGLAGLGGVAWLSTRAPEAPTIAPALAPQPLPPPPVPRTTIIAAAKPLRAGSLIKSDDITVIEVPTGEQPSNTIPGTREHRSELVGSMLRRSFGPNDPLVSTDLMLPGDRGFLAAVLGPDMRAATVGVDAVSGSAGLIWPGDYVDVILTQASDDASLPAGRRMTGENILENIRVVAVDQVLVRGAVAGQDAQPARTLTLEVTPAQAERLAVATRLGKVSVVVRSGSGTPAPPDPQQGLTYGSDVSRAFGDSGGKASIVKVFSGPAKGEEYKFQ
jgi:pilus assembly protein CpaB